MNRLLPHQIEPSTTDGQVLTTMDGETKWLTWPTLLLENGGSVPVDTEVGTLIFEKAS